MFVLRGAKRRLQPEAETARMPAVPGRVLLQPHLRAPALRKAQSDMPERKRRCTPHQAESSRPLPFSLREKPARLALELPHATRKQVHVHSLVRTCDPKRISLRTLHHQFGVWQKRARFERRFKFHALRHTCAYNLYKATRDIRVVQRQLRHSDINTTTIYAVPSDEDMSQAVNALQC